MKGFFDKYRATFSEGGKLHAFHSLFEGMETFMFVPHDTARRGTHIHDAIDSKRVMSMVILALIPSLLSVKRNGA